MASRPPEAPWLRPPLRSLAWVEVFLSGLIAEGFTEEAAVAAYRAYTSVLLGHLLLEVSNHGADVGPLDVLDDRSGRRRRGPRLPARPPPARPAVRGPCRDGVRGEPREPARPDDPAAQRAPGLLRPTHRSDRRGYRGPWLRTRGSCTPPPNRSGTSWPTGGSIPSGLSAPPGCARSTTTWPEVGSKLHHSVGAWPLLVDDNTEVIDATPHHSLTLRARAWPMGEASVHLRLVAVGAETERDDRGGARLRDRAHSSHPRCAGSA